MNVIQIVSDTLRRDHLGCYGNKWIHTENIDKLAGESAVFNQAYIASYPTIPHRHDLFTGRYTSICSTFTSSAWEPLPRNEAILSQLLRQNGYATMLIADTPHLIKDGYYFDRGFDGWWWIRGQESDRYMTNPTNDSPERKKIIGSRFLQNTSMRTFESDYFVAQTMTAAEKWLELNYDKHDKWFLHIDTFDPHEPWDPPRWYTDMYDPGWEGGEVPGAAYARNRITDASKLTDEQLKHLKALYAGEVTMVDRWLGILLEKINDLGLYDDTMIIFTSDHGTLLGEHNMIGKSLTATYEEVEHIPLIIRMPDQAGRFKRRFEGLVQPPDLMPSVLDITGARIPESTQGQSLLHYLMDEEPWNREVAVISPVWFSWMPGFSENHIFPSIKIITDEWSYTAIRKEASPKIKRKKLHPQLYHLPTDSEQKTNIYEERLEDARYVHGKMIEYLESINVDSRFIEVWKEN